MQDTGLSAPIFTVAANSAGDTPESAKNISQSSIKYVARPHLCTRYETNAQIAAVLFGLHPDGTVQANHFTIDHAIAVDAGNQVCILFRTAEAWWKWHLGTE